MKPGLFKSILQFSACLLFLQTQLFFYNPLLAQNQSPQLELKKYNIESGIIEFRTTGITSGKQTIYFEKWGMREATYKTEETKIMGITSKTNSLIIIDGEWVYSIDLDAKSGTKSKNMSFDEIQKHINNSDFNEQTMKEMNGEKIGREKIIGKDCDIWEVKKMGTKTWVWNGITLKLSTNIAGLTMLMEATKFQENVKIPPDKFKVPEDVRIVESRFTKDEIQK